MRSDILIPLCIFAYAVLSAFPLALFIVFGPWTLGVRFALALVVMFAVASWLANRAINHIEGGRDAE